MTDARPVREKPIIFSGPMVRDILEGRKSQTRRLLKPQPIWESGWEGYGEGCWVYTKKSGYRFPMAEYQHPIQPGDRLWIREAWRSTAIYDVLSPSEMNGKEPIRYECDETWQTWGWKLADKHGRLRPPIHMPRWASRITLEVTEVRVQRLQDISEEDAEAEGARGSASGPWGREGLIEDYSDIWEAIHGPGSWDANPWCCCISFERVQ